MVWNGVHSASWGQLGSYLIEKSRIWLRKSTLIVASRSRQFLLRIWPIKFDFLRKILLGMSRTCWLVTFSDHFIFSILLQHNISKLSKYSRSIFLNVQVSEPYKAMLQCAVANNYCMVLLQHIQELILEHSVYAHVSQIITGQNKACLCYQTGQ